MWKVDYRPFVPEFITFSRVTQPVGDFMSPLVRSVNVTRRCQENSWRSVGCSEREAGKRQAGLYVYFGLDLQLLFNN